MKTLMAAAMRKWYIYSIAVCLLIGMVYAILRPGPYTASVVVPLKLFSKSDPSTNLNSGRSTPTDFKSKQIAFLWSKSFLENAEKKAGLQVAYNITADKTPIKIIIQNDSLLKEAEFTIHVMDKTYYKLKSPMGFHTYSFGQPVNLPGVNFLVKLTNQQNDLQKDVDIKISNLRKIISYYEKLIIRTPVNKDTSAMRFEITDNYPDKALPLLTALSELYNGNKPDTTATSLRIASINRQLDTINRDLLKNNKKLEQATASVFPSIASVPREKVDKKDLQKQLDILKALLPYVKSPVSQFTLVPSTFGLKNNILNKLIDSLNETQVQTQQSISAPKPNSASLKHLNNKTNVFKQQTLNEIYVNIARINNVLNGQTKSSVVKPNTVNISLQNQQQAKAKIRLRLIAERKRLESALGKSNTISKDQYEVKIDRQYNGTLYILLISFLTGLFIPPLINIVSWFVLRKKPIRAISEVTSLPVLGEILHAELDQKILTSGIDNEVMDEVLTEEVQQLVGKLEPLAKNKLIAIQPLDNDKKTSFLSTNLAIILARLGKKVLIIHTGQTIEKDNLLTTINNVGLNDYLLTKSVTSSNIIQTSEIPNLSVIEAGHMYLTVPTTLSHRLINGLLAELKPLFEYIFFEFEIEDINQFIEMNHTPIDLFFYLAKNKKSSRTLLQSLKVRQQISKNIFLIERKF